MIKKIKIQNFQGHKDTELKLHPGVNIIRGSSHSGKTSIHRALKWALRNNPRGDFFRNWFVKKKEPIAVNIEFDDAWITRIKKGEENQYITNEDPPEAPLTAIRSDVPIEVSALTKIDGTNIHSQHDGFYWLDKNISGGQIAKELNEAVGLDIIDRTRAQANNIITKSKAESDKLAGDIASAEAEIEELPDLDKISKLVNNIDSLLSSRQALIDKRKLISDTLDSIEVQESTVRDLDGWLKVKKYYTDLKESVDKLVELKTKRDSISALIEDIDECNERIAVMGDLPANTDEVAALLKKIKKKEGVSQRYLAIRSLVKKISFSENSLLSATNYLDKKKKKFEKELVKNGECPLCLRKF